MIAAFTILLLGITVTVGPSDAGVVASQESESALESLGVPIPGEAIPSTNMWAEGNLLYGESTGPFFVYDLVKQEVIYSGNEDILGAQRNIMVDRQGNAYFGVTGDRLAKYDPRTNSVEVLEHTLPNFLRASTEESPDGWIYGATGQDPPLELFRYNPERDELEALGPSWGYTTHMVLDPTGRYFYYLPDAHGGLWRKGGPVLQYDTQTRTHKVIAFLHNFYEDKYGYRVQGTYALDIDDEGKRLFINMNGLQDPEPDSRPHFFDDTAVFVVHIPPSEAPHVEVPRLRFEDVASRAGLGGPLSNSYIHTASWGDVNNDGWMDLFAGTFVEGDTQVPNKLLLNHTGAFQDAGQEAVEVEGRAAGSVFADFDNDGDLDLFISNNRIEDSSSGPSAEPSRILRNDGGTFVDVTPGSGIEAQSSNGRQVGVLDYNNDGRLDLFVVADNLRGSGPTVLLENRGDFKFGDVTAQAGLPSDVHGLGLAIGDVTGNGWPDIFVGGGPAPTDQSNYMFIANGDGTYRQRPGDVFDWNPFTTGNEDWVAGAAFGDLNRDGQLDLLVGHHFGSAAEKGAGAKLRVYMNRGVDGSGNPVFEDITSETGLPNIASKAPHVAIQDFDNDGWPDLYTSVRVDTPGGPAPLIFTHNGSSGDPTFHAPEIVNPHYYAGGPVADFNRDGKLDVFLPEWRSVLQGTGEGQGAAPSMLMQNTGAPGNWLQIKVDDATPMGVGARVKIYRQGTSQLLGFREISPSRGFSSSQPAVAHFGLGEETFVDVVVEMPFGGEVYRRDSVPANRLVVMPDGPVQMPAHLGLEDTGVTDTSEEFLQGPDDLPPHTVASTPPTVDFVRHPRPDYEGDPWSAWGGALFASNGKFYSGMGDHESTDGNSYLYEYDPITGRIICVGDIQTATDHVPGQPGHGKIHSQINEARDGYIYFTSYRGSKNRFEASVILRYPINTVAVGGGVPGGPPALTSLVVSPSAVEVAAGSTQQFTASGLDQFGSPIEITQAIQWEVSGGGDIDESGLFTAGPSPGRPFTVTASVGEVSGTATVEVVEVAEVCGDQNGDGIVDVLDVVIDLQIAMALVAPTDTQGRLGDLNRDGAVNVFDAIGGLRQISGLTPPATACGPADEAENQM